MTQVILRCVEPAEYALWADLSPVPKVITNPDLAFCRIAMRGDPGWCQAERQMGRCCRDAATFRALERSRLAPDPDDDVRPLPAAPSVPGRDDAPIVVQLPNEPLFPEQQPMPTYTYPVTETVHAVDVLSERTVCGIPLMGFRVTVPRWAEQFNPKGRADGVTCRRCRQLAMLDAEQVAA